MGWFLSGVLAGMALILVELLGGVSYFPRVSLAWLYSGWALGAALLLTLGSAVVRVRSLGYILACTLVPMASVATLHLVNFDPHSPVYEIRVPIDRVVRVRSKHRYYYEFRFELSEVEVGDSSLTGSHSQLVSEDLYRSYRKGNPYTLYAQRGRLGLAYILQASRGSAINSSSSPGTDSKRLCRHRSLASSIRSRLEETKFHQM